MHQVLVDIILTAVIERYEMEENFYITFLNISSEEWKAWKTGKGTLSSEEMQKLKSLFSDYEWMLVQKILRQTLLFPEKRNYAVAEYKSLKTMIAKKWIQMNESVVEVITHKSSQEEKIFGRQNAYIILRVSLQYGEWGYDDILEFCLPSKVQKQIESSHVDLLEWVNENLADMYISKQDDEE